MQKIDKFYPKLYGISEKICCLFLLNVLMLISSVPIITIGAAISSGYTVCIKLIASDDTKIIKNYIKAFRTNFFQSTFIWMITFLLSIAAITNIHFLIVENKVVHFYFVGNLFILIGSVLVSQYGLSYIARYKDGLKNSIIKSTKLMISHPFTSISLFFMDSVLGIAILFSPYLFVFVLFMSVFIALSFWLFLKSYLFLAVFHKHEK